MPEEVMDFEEIHSAYRARLLRYLTRMVGEFDAEDLTQEVLIKISRSLGAFRGESQLSTWIYRIATNAALDRLRDPTLKRVVPDGLLDDPDANKREITLADIRMGAAAPSLEQQACRQERYECYCDLIRDLPVNYRTVIALSELQDLAAAEIADILGLSLDVVKIRLHRGRAKLLKALKEHCRPEDWL
jgi:RNA polymerase sigma-70 factor (ECF subfamily)